MNIDIYCDESRLELLDGNKNGYMVIGGLWVIREEREKLKSDIKALKQKYSFNVEIKWTKISNKMLPFYKELIDLYAV